MMMKKIVLLLVTVFMLSSTLSAAWWWPFGGKKRRSKPSKPKSAEMARRTNKISDPSRPHATPGDKPESAKTKKDYIKKLIKSADKGSVKAQASLGNIYLQGLCGLDRNLELAAYYLELAAKQNDLPAMFNYGLCLEALVVKGDIAKKKSEDLTDAEKRKLEATITEALKWYMKAANSGLKPAMINAALILERRQEYAKAAEYYYDLVKDYNYVPAMLKMATFCEEGKGGLTKDYKHSIYYLNLAAKQGNSSANLRLADYFQSGRGLKKPDYTEMITCLMLASQGGHPEAYAKLGFCYLNGYGVAKDETMATKYFTVGAEAKSIPSLIALGNCYREGIGVEKADPEMAIKMFRNAQKEGSLLAEYCLAMAYINGDGVKKDLKQAITFLENSSKKVNTAYFMLGNIYELGEDNITKNLKKAVQNYMTGARAESVKCYAALGRCYLYGIGVGKDRELAKNYLIKAWKHKSPVAEKLLNKHFAKNSNE